MGGLFINTTSEIRVLAGNGDFVECYTEIFTQSLEISGFSVSVSKFWRHDLHIKMAEPDLYDILGVSRSASDSEIKKVDISKSFL